MNKVTIKITGMNYGYDNEELKGYPTYFSTIEKVNEPVYVYSQFGWRDGCQKRDQKKIYPPFKIVSRKPGNVHTLGEILLECSRVETL